MSNPRLNVQAALEMAEQWVVTVRGPFTILQNGTSMVSQRFTEAAD